MVGPASGHEMNPGVGADGGAAFRVAPSSDTAPATAPAANTALPARPAAEHNARPGWPGASSGAATSPSFARPQEAQPVQKEPAKTEAPAGPSWAASLSTVFEAMRDKANAELYLQAHQQQSHQADTASVDQAAAQGPADAIAADTPPAPATIQDQGSTVLGGSDRVEISADLPSSQAAQVRGVGEPAGMQAEAGQASQVRAADDDTQVGVPADGPGPAAHVPMPYERTAAQPAAQVPDLPADTVAGRLPAEPATDTHQADAVPAAQVPQAAEPVSAEPAAAAIAVPAEPATDTHQADAVPAAQVPQAAEPVSAEPAAAAIAVPAEPATDTHQADAVPAAQVPQAAEPVSAEPAAAARAVSAEPATDTHQADAVPAAQASQAAEPVSVEPAADTPQAAARADKKAALQIPEEPISEAGISRHLHEAIRLVVENQSGATAFIARELDISWGAAYDLTVAMEALGIVGPADEHTFIRKVRQKGEIGWDAINEKAIELAREATQRAATQAQVVADGRVAAFPGDTDAAAAPALPHESIGQGGRRRKLRRSADPEGEAAGAAAAAIRAANEAFVTNLQAATPAEAQGIIAEYLQTTRAANYVEALANPAANEMYQQARVEYLAAQQQEASAAPAAAADSEATTGGILTGRVLGRIRRRATQPEAATAQQAASAQEASDPAAVQAAREQFLYALQTATMAQVPGIIAEYLQTTRVSDQLGALPDTAANTVYQHTRMAYLEANPEVVGAESTPEEDIAMVIQRQREILKDAPEIVRADFTNNFAAKLLDLPVNLRQGFIEHYLQIMPVESQLGAEKPGQDPHAALRAQATELLAKLKKPELVNMYIQARSEFLASQTQEQASSGTGETRTVYVSRVSRTRNALEIIKTGLLMFDVGNFQQYRDDLLAFRSQQDYIGTYGKNGYQEDEVEVGAIADSVTALTQTKTGNLKAKLRSSGIMASGLGVPIAGIAEIFNYATPNSTSHLIGAGVAALAAVLETWGLRNLHLSRHTFDAPKLAAEYKLQLSRHETAAARLQEILRRNEERDIATDVVEIQKLAKKKAKGKKKTS